MAQELIDLSAYEAPELPAEERLQTLVAYLKTTFFSHNATDAIAAERLETPALKRLDAAARPPASGPVVEEMARSVASWQERASTDQTILAIVLPPGDDSDIVRHWAERDGHRVLAAPGERADPIDLAALDAAEPSRFVVVPRLERWFLRTREGLQNVRALLDALDRRRQRAVISCNSFAWAFLSEAAGIDSFAGKAMTFRPFDADRLEAWLGGLAEAELARGVRFRFVGDGGEVFFGADEKPSHDFFIRLAGYSLGIPWVAWQMWRSALRTGDGTHEDTSERWNFWVMSLSELVLPGDYPREFLFALHAIALHGDLSPAELDRVLPEGVNTDTVAALAAARLVERRNGRLTLSAEAYPAVRSGLRSAGFPVGEI